MSDSYLGPRTKEREHEFSLLARITDDLGNIAREFNDNSEFDPSLPVDGYNFPETKVTPIPEIFGWSVCVRLGMGEEQKLEIFRETNLFLGDNTVELFVTPTTTEDGSEFVNPELCDDPQMWILVSDSGAIDLSNRHVLSYDQIIGLYNDVESIIKPLFQS